MTAESVNIVKIDELMHHKVEGIEVYFRHDQDRFIIEQIIVRDIYGLPTWANTVIDIGAHLGSFSLLAAIRNKAQVYAFEPEPENFKLLRHNIKANKLENRVHCFNVAVAPGAREQALYLGVNSGSHSLDVRLNGFDLSSPSCVVPTIPLEEVFEKVEVCDFLKIDAEGAEEYIVPLVLEKYVHRVRSLGIEFHRHDALAKLVPELAMHYEHQRVSHFEWRFLPK